MARLAPVGGNLRLARLFHGWSLDELAERIGRKRQYLHCLETEVFVAPNEVLEQIAEHTGVTTSFFYTVATAPISEEQCHFRRQLGARAAVKLAALAKGEVFRRLVQQLEMHVELTPPSIPHREVNTLLDIELAAEACRREWGLGLGPIDNMIRVLERAGAVVTTFEGVGREIDAHSISAARPIVVLNPAEQSACRLRFDLAHELGHLVMHAGQVTGDRKTEGEANRFAGAFLLPRSTFAKEFPKLRGQHLNWSGLVEMKLRWKVSKAALLFRARQLNLVTESQYKTGVIRLARGGEARKEHEDALVAIERPELFAHALELVREHRRLTLDAFASQAGVSSAIVKQFLYAADAASAGVPAQADVVSFVPRNVHATVGNARDGASSEVVYLSKRGGRGAAPTSGD